MRTVLWNRAREIFLDVADLRPEERDDALRRLCGEDAPLAASVRALLEADAAESVLDRPMGDLAAMALEHDTVRSLVERQIGPYRLRRVLGEGGMGVVYAAERTDIGGLVAIKLLRNAWMSPMRRERFEQERHTLARLNHPSIARIYDAGTLDDGTPWFVMEYVEGVSLTEWAAARNTTVTQRLRLLRQVCGAVSYAHRRAVVHRDLKPSNILVTDAGEVKLLDFGIAKDLSDDASGDLLRERTSDGLRLLTPGYAAPEQLRGEEVGLYTDVYALGVLLYELLTGKLPNAPFHAAPPSPSQVCARDSTGGHRALTRREWRDLDAACLTALEVEPERRYASVDAFDNDLDAFLEGRVLAARPPSRLYAAGKFLRRNRLPVLTATVAALLLTATVAFAAVRITRARDTALREAARSHRLTIFTESLFDGGNPSEGPSADLTAATLLKRGEIEAESLRDDPRLQSDMFATLGGVYQRLGQLDRADVLLQRAREERRTTFGQSDRQYAESLVETGLLRKDQGRSAEAEPLLRQAVGLDKQTLTPGDPAMDHAVWALSSALIARGQYKESEALIGPAVLRNQRAGRVSAQAADDLALLGDVRFYLEDYGRSTELYRQALEIYGKTIGDAHPSVAHVLNSLAHIEQNQGRFTEAERDIRQSLALNERWYGPVHPDVADDLAYLAQIFNATNREDQARDLLLRALAIQKQAYGHDHSRVALVLNELGIIAYNHDRDDEAEADFREALAIWRKTYGEHHQFVGLCHANLAGVFMDRKNYPEAEREARRALIVYSETLPEDHVNLAVVHVKLGRILLREQRYAEAEPESRRAYEYFRTHESGERSYLRGARKDLLEIAAHQHEDKLVAELTARAVPQ